MLKTAFTGGPLLLVGCGNMGVALAEGWLRQGLNPAHLHILEPAPSARAMALGAMIHAAPPPGLKPRAVVLAVKPQLMATILPGLASLLGPDCLILSIAAGTSLHTLHQLAGTGQIVRAMPNTPAAIGAGISALYAPEPVPAADRALAACLLQAGGAVVWLDSEEQMAAVTALSGSGPGYIFYLIECLTHAGTALGLGIDLARTLSIQTILGSAELARATGDDPAVLRRQVTSPNGTTEAGLDVLMSENGLGKLIHHTLEAAAKRARELAG